MKRHYQPSKHKRIFYIFISILCSIVILAEIIFLKKISRNQASQADKYEEYTYEKLTQMGNEAFTNGQFDMSMEYFLASKAKNPNNVANMQSLANLYRYRGRYEESEKEFKDALKIQQDALIYTDLGKLYRNWEKYDQAITAFEMASELDPNLDTIYSYGLGYLYRDMGDYKKAEENFKKAIEINPNNDFNYMGLGDLYRHTKRYAESEKYLRMAISMNSKSEAYMGLGWLYLDMGNLDKAKQAFEDYLSHIRPKAEIYLGLGNIANTQKNYLLAKQYFQKANDLNNTVGGVQAMENLKNTHPEIFE